MKPRTSEHRTSFDNSRYSSGKELPGDVVRAQLAKILKSRAFSNAPMLSRLLRFLVEHALENAEQPKEYVVGVEVFERGDLFNPQTDTIVRVQARRLRAKLEEFYRTEGYTDQIEIELPKGGYRAVFRFRSSPSPAPIEELVRDFAALGRRIQESLDLTSVSLPPAPPLPAPRTPLLGRERELAALKQLLLDDSVRLVTLTGPGGCGKTRLALQLATNLHGEFEGGVYFLGLAAIGDPWTVTSAIAQMFGVRRTGGKTLSEALRQRLRVLAQTPMMLFLDNFEHLLPAAPVVVELLEACASLKILVTSRAVLRVYGEHEYPVPPLPVPDPGSLLSIEELTRNPALALFAQRANAVTPSFALTAENVRNVAEVCARLDGLPLAIELAAARIKILPVAALLARLDSRLDLLGAGSIDLPDRQQTLRKTIDWSHDLLSPAEQRLFRRLSVFAGGCTLEGVEAVCDTGRDLEIDVLEGVASLVDKSLLQKVEHTDRQARFAMLETIREYGLERLAASGEDAAIRRAHAAYCLVLAEEGNAQLSEAERSDWLALCDMEQDNFRATIDYLIERDDAEWGLRLGLALFTFWERREHLAEGRPRLEALLNLGGPKARTRQRAVAANNVGTLMAAQGDYEASFELHNESLEIYRELGENKGVIAQLNNLGGNLRVRGDFVTARSLYEQSLDACRSCGDRPAIAAVLTNLAEVAIAQGDATLAESFLAEAMSIFQEADDWTGVGWCFNHLGDAARLRGDLSEARRLYQEGADNFAKNGDGWGLARSFSDLGDLACDVDDPATAHSSFENALQVFRGLEHKRGIARVLEGFARLAAEQEDPERALALAGAASALRDTMGAAPPVADQAKVNRTLDIALRHSGPVAGKAAWADGLRMQADQAIQYALDRRQSKPPRY